MSAAATLSEIGIADGLFLGTAEGFSCALKLQPADFEVRELNAVTHEPADITSHAAPAEPVLVHAAPAAPTAAALAAAAVAVAAQKPAAVESDAVPDDGWTAELQRLINHRADTWQQLTALDAAGRAAGRSAGDVAAVGTAAAAAAAVVPPALHIAAGADKQQRARVHRAVTEVFPFVRTQWHKPAAAGAATAGATAAGAAANGVSSVVDAAVDNGTIECTPNATMAQIAALLTPEQTEALQRFIQHTQPCKWST
jgi:hypothetical protein